jgi:outer membrane immunogenic protein
MTNRILSASAALFLTLPTASIAQDASAWAGFNIGIQATKGEGSQRYLPDLGSYDLVGNGFGGFVGYMMTSGAWAYGGELAYARSDYHEIEPDGSSEYPEYNFNHTLDLKARVGYAVDRALVYGVLGYGFSEYENGDEDPTSLFDVKGAIFGLGVDYLVSDRMFVGAEILSRDMGESDVELFDADLTTVTLRVGMKF